MYIPNHFKVQELVPPDVYDDLGDKAVLLFDDRLLRQADLIREVYGPMLINTWLWETQRPRTMSGWRPGNAIGSKYSQHKFGRALDMIPAKHYSPELVEEFRSDILYRIVRNDPTVRFIRALEDGVNWLHIDVRNGVSEESVLVFSPKGGGYYAHKG